MSVAVYSGLTEATVRPPRSVGGGLMATKPYGRGAYIDRMSDYCGGCAYDPKVRVGPTACPFTAGYWAYWDRDAERLGGNGRIRRALLKVDPAARPGGVGGAGAHRGSSPP